MVVYLDTLFFLDLVVDYLLLLSAARLVGAPLDRLRFACGALIGAAYSALLFLPEGEWLSHPLCKVGCAVLMVLTAFSRSGDLLRLTVVFFVLSCGLGGAMLAVELLLTRESLSLRDGVLYPPWNVTHVLIAAGAFWAVCSLVLRRVARHSAASGEIVPAILRREGHRVAISVLLDTGNTLTDPVTGKPVLVADWRVLCPLLPKGVSLDDRTLRNPVEAMETIGARGAGAWFRLLPYRAVGVPCGMLLALRLEHAQIGERDCGRMLAAFSPTPVSDGGGYSGLMGI